MEDAQVAMVVAPHTAYSLPEGVCAVVPSGPGAEAILSALSMLAGDLLVVQDEKVAATGIVDMAGNLGIASVGPTARQAGLEADRGALYAAVDGYLVSPRVVANSPEQLRRRLSELGGTGVVRPNWPGPHAPTLAVRAPHDGPALAMLACHGSVVVEPLYDGPIYTAYAAPGIDGNVAWSPVLRSFPFIQGLGSIRTGGMGTQSAEGTVTARWPALSGWAEMLFGQGEPWRTFAGIEFADGVDGPVILDLDCQIGNPETSTLMAGTSMRLTDLLASLSGGACPPWGASVPTASVALAVPGYPNAAPTVLAPVDFDALEDAGLRVDLGAYMSVASIAIAGPSRPAVVTAWGRSGDDALDRLRIAMPDAPPGLLAPDVTAELGGSAHDEGAVGAQIFREIERVVIKPARELLGPAVGDGLSVSASIAAASTARGLTGLGGHELADQVLLAVWPDGVAPGDWWTTPLGLLVGRQARLLANYRIAAPEAARMLGLSRARLYQLVEAGVLVKHLEGGFTIRSVLDRMSWSGP